MTNNIFNTWRCTEDPTWSYFRHHAPSWINRDKNHSRCLYCHNPISWNGDWHGSSIGTTNPQKIWMLRFFVQEWP